MGQKPKCMVLIKRGSTPVGAAACTNDSGRASEGLHAELEMAVMGVVWRQNDSGRASPGALGLGLELFLRGRRQKRGSAVWLNSNSR